MLWVGDGVDDFIGVCVYVNVCVWSGDDEWWECGVLSEIYWGVMMIVVCVGGDVGDVGSVVNVVDDGGCCVGIGGCCVGCCGGVARMIRRWRARR